MTSSACDGPVIATKPFCLAESISSFTTSDTLLKVPGSRPLLVLMNNAGWSNFLLISFNTALITLVGTLNTIISENPRTIFYREVATIELDNLAFGNLVTFVC